MPLRENTSFDQLTFKPSFGFCSSSAIHLASCWICQEPFVRVVAYDVVHFVIGVSAQCARTSVEGDAGSPGWVGIDGDVAICRYEVEVHPLDCGFGQGQSPCGRGVVHPCLSLTILIQERLSRYAIGTNRLDVAVTGDRVVRHL